MKKLTITCDCCGDEIQDDKVFTIEHRIHVSPSFNRMNGHCTVINGKTYSTSGRSEVKDFCLPCYNEIFFAMYKYIEGVQSAKIATA